MWLIIQSIIIKWVWICTFQELCLKCSRWFFTKHMGNISLQVKMRAVRMRLICKMFENRFAVDVMLISAWSQCYSTIGIKNLGYFSLSELLGSLGIGLNLTSLQPNFQDLSWCNRQFARNPSLSSQATKLATNRIFICNFMQNRSLQTHLQSKPIKSGICVPPSISFAPPPPPD